MRLRPKYCPASVHGLNSYATPADTGRMSWVLFIWCALILAWAMRCPRTSDCPATGSPNPQAIRSEANNEREPDEAMAEWRDPYDLPIVG